MTDMLAELRRSNLAAWLVAATLVALSVLTPFLPNEFRPDRPLTEEIAVRPAVATHVPPTEPVAERAQAWASAEE